MKINFLFFQGNIFAVINGIDVLFTNNIFFNINIENCLWLCYNDSVTILCLKKYKRDYGKCGIKWCFGRKSKRKRYSRSRI